MPLIPRVGGGSYAAEAMHKFGHVDHRARVRPDANLPVALGGTHAKFDPPPVDFGDFGLTCDDAPYYSRGEMADIDFGANRAFAGVEIGLDRVERCVLHDHNHNRHCEYRRQSRILEPVREMSGLTARVKEPLAPGGICLKACLRTSRERALRWHPTETITWRGCAQLPQ